MGNAKSFFVGLVGFAEREQRILKSVAALSTARPRSYAICDSGSMPPDLYLIDGDDPAACAQWASIQAVSKAPGAFVVNRDNAEQGKWSVHRPLVPRRLFELLDKMTVQELHFLPELHIGQDVRDSSALESAPVDAPDLGPLHRKALVVDDSPTVRKQMEIGLKLVRVAVDFAETGEQALYLFTQNTYDIVFLDVVLPGIDGYQVCRTMKRDKIRRDIPVVMLTGKSSTFDRVKGTFAGCDTYLTKPVDSTVFQNVLMRYLNINTDDFRAMAMAT